MTQVTTTAQAPETLKTDLLVALVPQEGWDTEIAALDAAFDGQLSALARAEGFEGKQAQRFQTHTFGKLPATRVLLIGLGDKALSSDLIRDLGGHAAKAIKASRAASAAVSAPWSHATLGGDPANAARLVAEGVQLGSYRFENHITQPSKAPRLEQLTLLLDADGVADSVKRAAAVVACTYLARDLGNEPPNVCTPAFLAEQASAIAERHGMSATILDPDAIVEKGFNLLMAVGRGASDKPRFIHLTYTGGGDIQHRVAFVGKGVTFDTGGYSLKISGSMANMHLDMGGAAAVLGAAEAIGRLAPEGVEVHFIVPTAKNNISEDAYTVNEIIKGYGGKTVEILNTDAEGRLLLADALAYASELGVDAIIDLATLTGACVVALGEHYSALFSNNGDLTQALLTASSESGDRLWHMPLDDRLRDKLKSPVADMKNVGDRWGGAITAALFLREWIGDSNWAHLDIAGPAINEQDLPTTPKGGSGAGVAVLTAYALNAARG